MQEFSPAKSRLLEDYRQPDGRLNLDRLGDDLVQDIGRMMREAAQTLRELYPPSKSRLSRPDQNSCRHLVQGGIGQVDEPQAQGTVLPSTQVVRVP